MQVGHPVNGTDIIPAFDHSVEILGDKAILVYPQSTGDAGTGAADEGQGKKYRQVGCAAVAAAVTLLADVDDMWVLSACQCL